MIIAALKLSHSILFCSNYFKPLVCRWRLIGMQAQLLSDGGAYPKGDWEWSAVAVIAIRLKGHAVYYHTGSK